MPKNDSGLGSWGLLVPAMELQNTDNSCAVFVCVFGGCRLNYRFRHIQIECPRVDINGLETERVTKYFDRKNDVATGTAALMRKAHVKIV